MKGKIDWFSNSRYYGFLIGEDGLSYFVPLKECSAMVEGGDSVTFTPDEGEKGKFARNVKLVEA